MEKTGKRLWVSRLLAVCMCMTVALMGVQIIPGADAKGGGGGAEYLVYQGPDVYLVGGQNLITPLCIPKKVSNNQSVTPGYWCDQMYGGAGYSIQAILITINGVMYGWNEDNHVFNDNGSFIIDGNRAYLVICDPGMSSAYLPLSGSYIKGYVPKLRNLDMLPGSQGENWVGPYIPFTPDPNPPVPPPPWAPWYVMASQYRDYLKDSIGNPYTGDFTLKVWNRTSQSWMVYYSWNTVRTDFVMFSNTWGFDREHQGVKIWVPNEGVDWHTHFA
jgi:hypothetical protein